MTNTSELWHFKKLMDENEILHIFQKLFSYAYINSVGYQSLKVSTPFPPSVWFPPDYTDDVIIQVAPLLYQTLHQMVDVTHVLIGNVGDGNFRTCFYEKQ